LEIASYVASLKINVSRTETDKVDKELTRIEKKVKSFSKNMGGFVISLVNFKVNDRNLSIALGTALDVASARLVFEVKNFTVDQAHLNATMARAMNIATNTSHPTVHPHVVNSPNVVNHTPASGRSARSSAVAGGMIGGGIGKLYGPALALALGGYGLSSLNKTNQKVVAAELQSQAVVMQADVKQPDGTVRKGTAAEGTDSFNWLRQQAKRIGFNYLDATQGYNNTLAGLTHAGMSVQQGQGVFKGFSEIGRVMKLDAAHQKRLLYAVSEVADMNELQKRQMNMIALALPGGKSLFAEAWQKKIGGKLTGQEAEDALLKAIKGRQVKGDILMTAADIASERAAPNLEKASHASQAEQARYQNSIADLSKVASDAGVEEGFARIFRTLSAGLDESGSLVEKLAEGFNEATKWASILLLFPQSFTRALEGKDSLVADWLGVDKSGQLVKDWRDIKQIFTDISTIKFDFLPSLEATAKEIAAIMGAIAEFQRWKTAQEKPAEVGGGVDPLGKPKTYGEIEKIDPFGFGSYTSPAGIFGAAAENTKINLNNARVRGQSIYDDKDSIFYHKPELYDENQRNMAADTATESGKPIVTQQFDISINIDPVTLAQMDVKGQAADLGQWFKAELEKAQVNFPVKE
jgi:hypothetical protein